MNTKIRFALAALSLLAMSAPAAAQIATGNEFATATPGKTVVGIVGMCVTAGNLAVPCGASGTGTAVTFPTGSTTTTGALQPPTASAGKTVTTVVSVSAAGSRTLVAANANRIGIQIQCDGTATVGVSQSGATLTSSTDTAVDTIFPATSGYPLYIPLITTTQAVTAYTATTQTCRVLEYLR